MNNVTMEQKRLIQEKNIDDIYDGGINDLDEKEEKKLIQ